MDCILYCANNTPRLSYVNQLIFNDLLGVHCRVTNDVNVFGASSLIKINYSKNPVKAADLWIPASDLLFEKGIRPYAPRVKFVENLPCFFDLSHLKADFSFDLLAMCFFLVARYEEYLPVKKDMHQRFPAHESLAFCADFLNLPVVDKWVANLGEKLKLKFPDLKLKKNIYTFQPGFDIDYAWAFLHRGFLRRWGSRCKKIVKGNFQELILEHAVLTGKTRDPYYNFPYMESIHRKFNLLPRFFFLLADYGRFDHNHHWQNPFFQQLIRELGNKYPVGIHPSYFSTQISTKLFAEKQRLETIIGRNIRTSRQHFLRIDFPETYENLLKAGIREDFSLGFADAIGFRAGIARPFFWYNLKKEEKTDLLLHPVQVMDVTLNKYLQLTPEQAIAETTFIIKQCKNVGGQFQLLWHNSSLTDKKPWAGWRKVYEKILEEASAF